MKWKALLISGLILCAASILHAQKEPDIEVSDPDAIQLLDKVRNKLNKAKNYAADFTFTVSYPTDQDDVIKKGALLQQGAQYFVDIEDQTMTCDGQSVWVHMIADEEVQITDVEESTEGFNNPSDFLSIYEKEEFIFGILQSYFKGKDVIKEIEFKPTDEGSEFSKVRIVVNDSKKRIEEVITFYKSGIRYHLVVDDLQLNVASADGTFVFDPSKFPGIHVEDLRY